MSSNEPLLILSAPNRPICPGAESGDPVFVFLIWYCLIIVIHGFGYLYFLVILVFPPSVFILACV